MKTYFVKDIDKRFTDVVNSYISKGYSFFCNTMSGSQGEKARVHLISPKRDKIVNVFMHTFSSWREGTDGIEISVREYNDIQRYHINEYDCMSIIWNNEGTEVSKEVFYKIDRDRDRFYGDMEALKNARGRRVNRAYDRWENKSHIEKDITSSKNIDIVYPWIKKQYKCTSTLKKDVVAIIKCTDIKTDKDTNKEKINTYYKIGLDKRKYLFLGKRY